MKNKKRMAASKLKVPVLPPIEKIVQKKEETPFEEMKLESVQEDEFEDNKSGLSALSDELRKFNE